MRTAKRRKKTRYSKILVIFCITSILAFITAGIMLAVNGVYLSDAWVYCTFGFFGAEAGILGWIKTSETKGMTNKNNNNEEAAG